MYCTALCLLGWQSHLLGAHLAGAQALLKGPRALRPPPLRSKGVVTGTIVLAEVVMLHIHEGVAGALQKMCSQVMTSTLVWPRSMLVRSER